MREPYPHLYVGQKHDDLDYQLRIADYNKRNGRFTYSWADKETRKALEMKAFTRKRQLIPIPAKPDLRITPLVKEDHLLRWFHWWCNLFRSAAEITEVIRPKGICVPHTNYAILVQRTDNGQFLMLRYRNQDHLLLPLLEEGPFDVLLKKGSYLGHKWDCSIYTEKGKKKKQGDQEMPSLADLFYGYEEFGERSAGSRTGKR